MSDHGTDAGYWRHHRRNEEACGPCKAARSAYVTGRRKGPYESTYDNPYTREADEQLAENPPEIKWRKNRRGVFEAVEVRDPHAETSLGAQAGRMRRAAAAAEREHAAQQAERRRQHVLELMREEAAEVVERFRKHRAENTPLMAAARTEI